MKLFISFLPALFSLCIFTAYAQSKTQNPEWIIYNTSNSGLPNNNIMCIAIDLDGKKWIGTYGGVAVFDDSTWTVYDSTNSGLIFNTANYIAVDKYNNKWMAGGWLIKFDGNTWTVFDTSNSGIPPNPYISEIKIDTNNIKWIGSSASLDSAGLIKFDDNNWVIYNTFNSQLTSNDVDRIDIENNISKWMDANGLTRFDDVSWLNYNSGNSGLPSNDIRAIAVDAQGNKWLGVYATGLVRFDGSNWTIDTNTCIGTATPYSITIDAEGTKWMGGGAWLAKLNDTVCQKYNQSNSGFPNDVDYVTAIAIDKYGNKWLGCPPWMSSINGGLAVFREGGVILSTEDKKQWEAENENKIKVLVYPNPFSDCASVQITKGSAWSNQELEMFIYDVLGREVQKHRLTTASCEIERGDLTAGIYLYEIKSKTKNGINNIATGKLIITGE